MAIITVDTAAFGSVLGATVGYFLLYYVFVINCSRVRHALIKEYKAAGKKFDRYFGQDKKMLQADRTQLNMLEQMPPFVVTLWLYAVFVDAGTAGFLGWVYVASRALYPIVTATIASSGRLSALVLVSTIPNYLVIVYFAVGLARVALA